MRVRITCGNVPGAPPYSWQKLAEGELDCSGTIDARFCAWRTPGGVKSVNLCELSVPGTEARCRPSHYRLSDDPQLRTGARKNCTIDDAALTWACPPPAPAPNCFAGGVKSVNLCELSVPGTEARCHRDEGGANSASANAESSYEEHRHPELGEDDLYDERPRHETSEYLNS